MILLTGCAYVQINMELYETMTPMHAYILHKLAMMLIDVSGGFYLFYDSGWSW